MGGPVLVGRNTGVAGIAVLPESSPGSSEIKQVRILISANSILGDSGGPVLDDFGDVIGLIQGNLTAPFMDETQRPVIYIRPARDSKGNFINDQIGKQKLEATDLYARSGIAAVIPSYFVSQLISRNAAGAGNKD
jgi:S1-C subfamily serine protease